MSNYLTGLAQLNPTTTRFDGGSTSYSLPVASTSNQTLVFINGVCQHPGTDYSISSNTLTMSSTVPAGTNVLQVMQLFETGIVNTVSDNSIGLGQMANGVDGNVISYDASGNPVAIATGSDGQVLTSTGAGSPPAFEALPAADSGGFVYVSSLTASSSSTLTFSGLADGFDYQVIATQVVYSGTGSHPSWRVGIADGTIRSSGYISQGSSFESSTNNASSSGTSAFELRHVATAAVYEQTYQFNFIAPMTSGTKTSMLWWGSGRGSSNSANYFGGGVYNTAEANERIQFFHTNKNVNTGLFKLYKRANV